MSKIRIMIVDDHRVIREGLGAILQTKGDIDVVGEATNGLEAIALAKELRPDVILMDMSMPKMNGMEATQKIKDILPETGIVALTMHDDDPTIFDLVRAGVDSYLLKDTESEEISNAIRAVRRGESMLDPSIAKKILRELTRRPSPKEKVGNKYRLSPREIGVLQKVSRGKTNKEIANDLLLSEKTVKNHLRSIFAKMEVDDRTKAAIKGIQEGIIVLDQERPGIS